MPSGRVSVYPASLRAPYSRSRLRVSSAMSIDTRLERGHAVLHERVREAPADRELDRHECAAQLLALGWRAAAATARGSRVADRGRGAPCRSCSRSSSTGTSRPGWRSRSRRSGSAGTARRRAARSGVRACAMPAPGRRRAHPTSHFGKTLPVGFDGEFTITTRVRGVIARAIASMSSEKSVGSSAAATGTRLAASSIGS